jgi:hypothetical protein
VAVCVPGGESVSGNRRSLGRGQSKCPRMKLQYLGKVR